ncbi:MAG: hypothetical protein ACR2PZ_07355 [Pseudomonadales bacterium]
MNWEAIGAVGEVLGAVGVILTLVYLAAQIRQNTAMMTAQTVQASVDATQRVLLFRAEHADIRAVLRKARDDEKLNRDEFELLTAYLQATFMNFQARLQHNTRGVFDASVNESYEKILIDYLEGQYVQRWWDYSRALYGAAFREHCDQIIRRLNESEDSSLVNWREASSSISANESANKKG